MKYLRSILIAALLLNITGCAGLFVAGAATTINVVTDPRSSKELLKDQDISLQASAIGNKDPLKFNVRVSATTFRGNVLLMGQAVTQEYKDKVAIEVGKIKGVNTIYNQIKVRPLLKVGDISNDVWITTKVKSHLIADKELKDVKISVYSEDAEVFLVGAVTPKQAEAAVEVARNISGVQRVIKVFYYGEENQPKTTNNPAPAEELTETQPVTTQELQPQAAQSTPSDTIPYIEPIEEGALTEEDL